MGPGCGGLWMPGSAFGGYIVRGTTSGFEQEMVFWKMSLARLHRMDSSVESLKTGTLEL